MKLRIVLLVFAILLHAVVVDTRQAGAQGPTTVALENVAALVSFGSRITFFATVKSPSPVRDAAILILDETRGITDVEPLTLQADGRTEFQYDAHQNNLRPFGALSWTYRFTLPDGSTLTSEVYSTHYDDNRFSWQTLETDTKHVGLEGLPVKAVVIIMRRIDLARHGAAIPQGEAVGPAHFAEGTQVVLPGIILVFCATVCLYGNRLDIRRIPCFVEDHDRSVPNRQG